MVRWLQFLPPAQRIGLFAAADVSRETIGKLKLPVVLSYRVNSRSNEEIHNLEVKIANLQLQLKGGNESRKWVNWLKDFGQYLNRKKELGDEERKQYLSGLIEEIKVKYDEKKNEHELSIQFQLPIVGDGISWKNPAKKSEGYKIKKGKREASLTVKKKILDGQKRRPKWPPNENSPLRWNSLGFQGMSRKK